MPDTAPPCKLIVTIVPKGSASRLVTSTMQAGAKGGTILLGRGTAPESVYLDILGINFEPEKEILLTLCAEELVGPLLKIVLEEGQLNQPGKGVAFVMPVKGIEGILHLLKPAL